MALTPWKKQLNRKAKCPEKEARCRRHGPWRRLYLERLEERLAPASLLSYNFGTGGTDPRAVTLQLDLTGTTLQIINDADSSVLTSQLLSSTSSVQVTGASGKNDQLTVNFSSGDFFSNGTFSGGITFTANSGDTDVLVVKGSGTTATDTTANSAPSNTTAGSGSVTVATPAADPISSMAINFSGLTAATAGLTVQNMATFTLTPQDTAATLTISSPMAGEDQISGTSGVAITPVNFFGIPTVALDASATTGNDTVTLSGGDASHVLVASGLKNFKVDTGSGNDKVAVTASSFALPASSGSFTVNTGGGGDTLDFTNFDTSAGPLTISMDKTLITAHDMSVLTQAGTPAEHVDVNLASGVKTAVDNVLNDLSGLAGKLQTGASALSQLTDQLPLLSRSLQGGVAQLLNFANKVQAFVTNAEARSAALAARPTSRRLSTISMG